ncbi:response regulator [Pseudomonas fluorescens]|nr:response regulator [Pseudomonas fluorescens]TKK02084.1 response regulator [Pseudomonas fluorescens]
MAKNILIVEDNNHKREKIISFLKDKFPLWSISEAHSFTAGCQRVLENAYDVILLDMSLPTYDKSATESGGRFRTFGGREIARKVVRRKIQSKILFITQFESFSERGHSQTLQSIDGELHIECGTAYLGLVYYDSSKSIWKEKISIALGSLENENINN